ncbi:photosystem II protein PsbQ [Oscillatoria sp. FACHB-1407]|uniref:photosystem II protein PsbQ n=1 Tax=Oscillatoria sp. FACHB-1407 TaxID=2692847 RepID=UPI0016880723|nr:photosystem II protein PsbQ [Oscillatoria sp. FACHB-1407]MBD2464305.1 photosystem II protein PsbQ [Oscillatoria sp. FACHB-1407]
MMKYRSVLSVILAAIAVFLVSCSNPTSTAKAPTYTPQQLEQIQDYLADVQELRDRLLEIPPLVQKERWVDVQSFIHGPLGELRFKMGKLARSLEPNTQKQALAAAQEVFEHLILIDEATQTRDSRKAFKNYNEALKDIDAFLTLAPQPSA